MTGARAKPSTVISPGVDKNAPEYRTGLQS